MLMAVCITGFDADHSEEHQSDHDGAGEGAQGRSSLTAIVSLDAESGGTLPAWCMILLLSQAQPDIVLTHAAVFCRVPTAASFLLPCDSSRQQSPCQHDMLSNFAVGSWRVSATYLQACPLA